MICVSSHAIQIVSGVICVSAVITAVLHMWIDAIKTNTRIDARREAIREQYDRDCKWLTEHGNPTPPPPHPSCPEDYLDWSQR